MDKVYHLPAPSSHASSRMDHRPAERWLLLHCSGSSGRQWDAYRSLLPRTCELRTPNLMGYDTTEAWPLGKTVCPMDEAQRLAETCLADHDDGLHLVGHSYGGWVALQLALRAPHRVRSLTLYEPVCFGLLRGESGGPAYQEIHRVAEQVNRLNAAQRCAAAAELFIDFWSGPGAWGRLSIRGQQLIALRMPKIGAEFDALFADTTPSAAYARLPMPVHLIQGTRSPLPALRTAALLAEGCSQAHRTCLQGLGHMGPIEAPERVAACLAGTTRAAPMDLAA